MALPPDRQPKRQTLRRHGTLNPQPESVTHSLFQNSDFFDPDDLLQVKYEMLRQVHVAVHPVWYLSPEAQRALEEVPMAIVGYYPVQRKIKGLLRTQNEPSSY